MLSECLEKTESDEMVSPGCSTSQFSVSLKLVDAHLPLQDAPGDISSPLSSTVQPPDLVNADEPGVAELDWFSLLGNRDDSQLARSHGLEFGDIGDFVEDTLSEVSRDEVRDRVLALASAVLILFSLCGRRNDSGDSSDEKELRNSKELGFFSLSLPLSFCLRLMSLRARCSPTSSMSGSVQMTSHMVELRITCSP
jgi:hypothetical protein